jgi:DNA-directed RNA polymerase III subunit RPC1
MEAKERPVDFVRAMMHVQNTEKGGSILLPGDIFEFTNKTLASPSFSLCSEMFKDEIRRYLTSFCEELIAKRHHVGWKTTMKSTVQEELKEKEKKIVEWNMANNLLRLSDAQLLKFLNIAKDKFQRARIEPGTAVGAIGAQRFEIYFSFNFL